MYCFAHCAHFVAPIVINGEHKGTMFAGQFIPQRFSEEQLTEIRRIAEEINVDPELQVKEAKRMRVVEEEKVMNYSSLLFQIVGVIARLGAQSAELNRAKNKLQKGVLFSGEDITERKRAEEQIKASLREKEVLLKEIHHRVKNNLQVIISLLNLKSKHIKDKHDLEIFKDSQNRIKSMALIHDKLYQSKDLASIDFAEYIETLVRHLFNMYRVRSSAIKLVVDIKDVSLDINTAIPGGLIINELISNSLKYAFPDGQEGEILIKLYASKDDTFTLIISDNGIGLPEDLDFRNTESLGLQVVVALVEQLKGTIELDRSEGTAFKIVFKNA